LATEHRKRVLVVDADSQGNSTEFFGGDPQLGNLANILLHDETAYFNAQTTEYPGLEILPASDRLMELDLTKIQAGTVKVDRLKRSLDDLEGSARFDFVLIDCPPAFTASCAAALIAATDVIIPIKLDAFSMRGMANLMAQIQNMKRLNPRLNVLGCLETMWAGSKADLWADDMLRKSGLPIFGTRIRASKMVGAMTFEGKPLRQYSPNSAAAVDYRRFCKELVGGECNG
jgi:chromosome partitioning protein